MDREMGRWVDGVMDSWMDGWMGENIDGWLDFHHCVIIIISNNN